MSQPTPYSRQYDFSAFSASNPSDQQPGQKLDDEFEALLTTLTETLNNLEVIQRDDGALNNLIVTYDSLSSEMKALLGSSMTPRGDWAGDISYDLLDLVNVSGKTYIANVAHTSTSFTADLAAGYWLLWANPGAIDGTTFFQKFSGDGSTVAFTLSTDLGTDEKGLMIFTKDAGSHWAPQDPDVDYTVGGTTLTFAIAPLSASDNVYVFSPAQLLGAAAAYATAANASALAAASSASSASNDAASTAADVITTSADVVSTTADAAQTALDVIATTADAVTTSADAASTAADVVTTNADAITTTADAASAASDATDTGIDAAATAADATSTAADAVSTAADAASAAASAIVAGSIEAVDINITNAVQLGKSYAAQGDGTTHPLSEFYASLAEAQADYPLASALTQEIDAIVIEQMIDDEATFLIPAGAFLVNYQITYSNKAYEMKFDREASIKASVALDYMFYGTDADVKTTNMTLDGNDLAFNLFRVDDSSIYAENTYVHNIGNLTLTATLLASGMTIDNPKEVYINKFKGRVIKALGDGTFANGPGAARFLVVGNGASTTQTGFCYISNLDFDATDCDAEELDLFQCNIDNVEGGFITNIKCRYNEYTRRCLKFHLNNWTVTNVDIRPLASFTPVSVSTDVGERNLNCVDWANGGVGHLILSNAYIDASGYKLGIGNTGGIADFDASNIYLKGGTKRVIRTNPETGAPEDTEHTGYYTTGAGGNGSGLRNSKIEGFTTAVNLQGDLGYVENVEFIDPVEYAAYLGFSTNRKSIRFNNNTIITKTSGNLNLGRVIRVFDVSDIQVNGNRLIEDGNTTHSSYFIQFTDTDCTGEAINNSSPAAAPINTVNVGTADIMEFGTDGGALNITNVTFTYTFLARDDIIQHISGAVTLSLPNASDFGMKGKEYIIKRTSTGLTTIASLGGTIDGKTNIYLESQYEVVVLYSDGWNWLIKNQSLNSACGSVNMIANATATTINTISVYEAIAGTFVPDAELNMTVSAAGVITYNGNEDKHCDFMATFDMTCAANNQSLSFRWYKNGTTALSAPIERAVGTGTDVGAAAVGADTILSSGDTVQLKCSNATSTANITVKNIHLFAATV